MFLSQKKATIFFTAQQQKTLADHLHTQTYETIPLQARPYDMFLQPYHFKPVVMSCPCKYSTSSPSYIPHVPVPLEDVCTAGTERGMHHTSTEHLKRVYTSPGQILEIFCIRQIIISIIIYNYISVCFLKLYIFKLKLPHINQIDIILYT